MDCQRRASARAAIAAVIAGLLLPISALAQAQATATPPTPEAPIVTEPLEPTPQASRGAAAFDALVLRPLGFAALPIGVAFFIPAALTTAPNGMDSVQTALEFFITNPANYVFQRPLGEF